MSERYSFFTFQKELSITRLVSLFYHKSPRNFLFPGESHDFWEFIYIDKGKMLITAGEKQYVLRAGELAFHKPGEFHAVSAYERTQANFIIAAFVCGAPCMRYFEHRIMSLHSKEREYLYAALRAWQSCLEAEQSPYALSPLALKKGGLPFGQQQAAQQNLELMLLALIQRNEGVQIQYRVESYAAQAANKRLTENVIRYLEAHITESVTLGRIAVELGYSVPQMKKLFHAQMRRGIIDYFIGMKMDEARRLMQEGELNITQIAQHFGYPDASYFSRLFKARFNMTPTEYCRSFGGA